MRLLAGDTDPFVRTAVAANPAVGRFRGVAEALAADQDLKVRLAAAANPGMEAALLAEDPDVGVRAAVAARCDVGAVTAALSADQDLKVRLAAASNPDCPAGALDGLSTDSVAAVRAAAAAHRSCPPEALDRLASDPDERVLAATAANPNCPSRTLGQICCDGLASVRAQHHAAANPNCSPDALAAAAAGATRGDTAQIAAANPACPPQTLRQLLDDNAAPYTAGASVPAAPLTIADTQYRAAIRAAVASNPAIGADLVERLAADPEEDVWERLARNPACSPAHLFALARGNPRASLPVFYAAARNPSCPPDLLEWLAERDHTAAVWVARRSDAPAEMLAQMTRSPHFSLRELAFQNPNCPVRSA